MILTVDKLALAGLPEHNARRLMTKLRARANGCWDYYGHRNEAGSPKFTIKDKGFFVGRLILEAVTGEKLGRNRILAQTCSDKTCVNPEHQRVMTRKEHMKTLDPAAYRTKKLDWGAVKRIRSSRDLNMTEQAKIHNVSRDTISRIIKNETWTTSIQRSENGI